MHARNPWWLSVLAGSILTGFVWAGQPLRAAATPMPESPRVLSATFSKATLRFDLYRNYLIVVCGSAGSLKDLNFLVDTGASPTVLDRRLAQKLHLQERPASISVVSGSVEAGRANVSSLQLGPVRKEEFPVLIEDLSFFQKALPVRIDAVLGLDMLGQMPFEIDYTTRAIHFGSVPSLDVSLPLRLQAGLPIIDAELNNVAVRLLLDTGASSLLLFEPRTQQPGSPLRISTGEAAPKSPNTIGEFAQHQVWLRSLRLGEMKFGRQTAFLAASRSETTQNFEGLLSPAALGITRITIDLEHGVAGFSR